MPPVLPVLDSFILQRIHVTILFILKHTLVLNNISSRQV